MITLEKKSRPVGVMLSGGLDSSILLAHLLASGREVQPFYVRSELYWQAAELGGLRRFLETLPSDGLRELVVLDLPLVDVYQSHWSLTGADTPDAKSEDEAVYLPSRNALLLMKAAVWCQLQGIEELALATLGTSPFDDATEEFFHDFEKLLNRNGHPALRILCPFASLDKKQVMHLGRGFDLQWTFSCISPVDNLHCGRCNKCEERRKAFEQDDRLDNTIYAPAFDSKDQIDCAK